MTKNGQSWNDIRQYYLSFGEGPWLERHRPMLTLIAWIETENLTNVLFASVGMSGLWISDRPGIPFKDGNMLQILMITPEAISFQYHREPGSIDGLNDGMKKSVSLAESIECLRQFLAYKFGIHRSFKGGNAGSPTSHSLGSRDTVQSRISVADILGDWVDPGWDSGLVIRCRDAWGKPLQDLSRQELATFLRQKIAVEHILPIAKKRLTDAVDDDTEIYDGELQAAIDFASRTI